VGHAPHKGAPDLSRASPRRATAAQDPGGLARRTMGAPGAAPPAAGAAMRRASMGMHAGTEGRLRRVSTATRPLALDSGDVAAEILPPPSPGRPRTSVDGGAAAGASSPGRRASSEWWRHRRGPLMKAPQGAPNA